MPRKTLEERFWEKVDKQPGDGCWEWTAYRTPRGYGQFGVEGTKAALAHRVSWFLEHGQWPRPFPKYTLDHLCRNPSCVRPDHLEDVTHNENIRRSDKTKAGAVLRTGKCVKGHDDWYYGRKGRACRACQLDRNREYQKENGDSLRAKRRSRYANDPEYREKKKAAARARYANDSEYREKQKAAARARYANDPEYREKKNARKRAYYARKRAEKESAA